MQGPNVKRLIAHRMATIGIPAGCGNGLAAGLSFLSSPEKLKAAARQATKEIEAAIAAVKTAPDNKWGNDDEAIAAEILRQIEERKKR